MIYKTKRQLKKYFRQVLHIIISLQLCFIPCYSYSADEDNKQGELNFTDSLKNTNSDSTIQRILDQHKAELDQQNPEAFAKIKAIIKLAEAIETGKVKEYLADNPRTVQERDHFLLADQIAESLEYHIDSEKNEVIERVRHTSQLNDYGSRPIQTVFKSVRVQYDEQARELIFEGVSAETVLLRQRIPDMDIIGYAHDKEMLLLLDKKKGLLLVDMFFARAYLGTAPVPFTKIPIPILQVLEREAQSSGTKMDTLSLEFINRSVRPPDIMPEYVENIDKNFRENHLFKAGDFMISYTDKKNQKHLVQFLKRKELAAWLGLHYDILDIMTKVVAPHLMQAEDLQLFTEKMDNVKQTDPSSMLDHVLSALFTKNALSKLTQAAEGMKVRVSQLKDMSSRDTMLYEEWQESFNKISSRLQSQNSVEQKSIGNLLMTKEIADLYQSSETEEQKNIRAKALRIMANIISSFKPGKIMNFIDNHRVSTAVVGSGVVSAFLFPEKFILLANEFMPLINNLSHTSGFSAYSVTSIPNLVTMLAFFPSVIILLSFVSIPFLNGLKKMVPKNFSIANKVYHPKGWMEDVIQKWERTTISQRIVGMGLKFVAYTIYPFWNYFETIVGQPHFFSAISKGLNPIKKIHPDSDIGEMVRINKATRLGTQGWRPQWRQNGSFDQHRELQNIAETKEQRMKSVAWLMASLAVSEKMQVNPEEILIYGSSMNLDKLGEVHNDKVLRGEMFWVMENLLKEIRALDEMDIRKELAELDPKMVLRYYEKAIQLAGEVRNHTELRKKIRSVFNAKWVYAFRQKMNLRTIAGINKAQHNMLKNIPSDFVTGRVVTEFATDHAMVALIPLLTTDRAEFSTEHLSQMVVNDSNFSWSGKPHLNEVWLNVIAHFFIAGGQTTMTFQKPTSIIAGLHKAQEPVYEPSELHVKKTAAHPQGELTYYKKQLAVFFSGGKEENLGQIMWRSYISRFRSIQMTISLMVGMRLLLTTQSIGDAALGYLLYHFAAQWVFGWPWDIIRGGSKRNTDYLTENKEKMENLKLKLSKVARGLYINEETLKQEYEEALVEINSLYKTASLRKKLINSGIGEVSPQLVAYMQKNHGSLLQAEPLLLSINEMRATSEKLVNLLTRFPPLPYQPNQMANLIFTTAFGGILTTYLFVALSVWTFTPEYLNWQTIGTWAGINYAAYGTFYFLYKKGLRGHLDSVQSWRQYAYNGFLNLNRSVRSMCRRAFSSKSNQ